MGHVIITTAILVGCFLVNADFVGKTCSQHHWNIVVSIYFWFCLQSKVFRKGRRSLPRMFFVAFAQFVSKLFFPKMYWDFNGWACNPAGGPQDPQGCNYCNYMPIGTIQQYEHTKYSTYQQKCNGSKCSWWGMKMTTLPKFVEFSFYPLYVCWCHWMQKYW